MRTADQPGRAGAALTEGFLLESKEDGVYEFEVLKVIVDHVVEFESLRRDSDRVQTREITRVTHIGPHLHVAEAIEYTMLVDPRNDVLQDERDEQETTAAEESIVQAEE